MSYQAALEATGAVVHEFKEFGDYQGSWYALVTYKGETGWVAGSYGSCSGCDAFQAEFGYDDNEGCSAHRYRPEVSCEACKTATAAYTTKLCSFGQSYVDPLHSVEQILADLDSRGEWDSESKAAADWIRSLKGS